MVTVYGADWCEDTRRSLRHLRRLGVAHRYLNVDEDAEALARAMALNEGSRRTPTIDLGVGGAALVEPENDTLGGALVELEMLTQEEVVERLGIQNVGDAERAMRTGIGLALVLAGNAMPRSLRWPLRLLGAATALSGLSGWCPGYHATHVTSLLRAGGSPRRSGAHHVAGPAMNLSRSQLISDYDLYLFGEGNHTRIYDKFGAHLVTVDGVEGTHFAVWAPNAAQVSVVGDFNAWDGRAHPMEPLAASGAWAAFVPVAKQGQRYKYEIRTRHGALLLKSDPYGQAFELPPATASIICRPEHAWQDGEWMRTRAACDSWFERPMSTYEVHLGSWARIPEEGDRYLTYAEIGQRLIPYVKEMGYTHIELLPVMEHPFSGSWGYQVTGFYAPTSRFGRPQDFKAFVDECHQHGIGVILDWVPGHFPKDAYALAEFDGTALYEHADPRQGEHRDWGTLIFNYGRNEVRNFLLANALYWLDEYHVDGLRVDAVASMLYLDYSRKQGEWVPNRFGGRENLDAITFLRQLNTLTHAEHPGSITIAEESTSWPSVSRPTYVGGLGFTYKWNMGWMNDILEYVKQDPIHRRYHHRHVTFSLLYAFSENFILPFSHDEVVHGKGSMFGKVPGDDWQKAATLRALYGFMYAHPGKKLMFMGCEFGQGREWNHDRSLDWHLLERPLHAGLKQYVADLNRVYGAEPAMHELDFNPAGFQWIDCNDNDNSVVSFMRRAKNGEVIVTILNFTPVPRDGYRIGVPTPGAYDELINSDSEIYGGGNLGNAGVVFTEPIASHGHEQSLRLNLPPLGFLLLKPAGT